MLRHNAPKADVGPFFHALKSDSGSTSGLHKMIRPERRKAREARGEQSFHLSTPLMKFIAEEAERTAVTVEQRFMLPKSTVRSRNSDYGNASWAFTPTKNQSLRRVIVRIEIDLPWFLEDSLKKDGASLIPRQGLSSTGAFDVHFKVPFDEQSRDEPIRIKSSV